jgi:hypothetical protein
VRSGENFTIIGESYNGVIYGEALADREAFYDLLEELTLSLPLRSFEDR